MEDWIIINKFINDMIKYGMIKYPAKNTRISAFLAHIKLIGTVLF
jgi:hypothetical protein